MPLQFLTAIHTHMMVQLLVAEQEQMDQVKLLRVGFQ